MSLLSAILLPALEKQLIALEPMIATFVVNELKTLTETVAQWIEDKAHHAANSEAFKE